MNQMGHARCYRDDCISMEWVTHLVLLRKQSTRQNVSEYDQEITQSHTADQPTTPRGRVTEHF